MSQQQMSNTQESTVVGGNAGGFNTTTGYVTGASCPFSGTFRASNRYMDIVMIYAAGEIFLPFCDGKKATWYALTKTLTTNKDGSFTSVKVDAGAV